MLDTMRRNVRRLSWTLWLVIAAFIILYFPDFFAGGTTNVVARVDGQTVTLAEYRNALNEQLNYYRNLNQGELPDNFIQQMQLHNIVVEQLVRQRLILAAARDQGFAIAPQEIRDRLLQYPAFTDADGNWIGMDGYRDVLVRSGIDQATFEQQLVDELLVERVTGLITEGVQVTEGQVREMFQRQNERVRFEYVQVRPAVFELEVSGEIDDAALQARYDANTETYRLPERRRVSFAVIDTESLRDSVEIDEATLRAEYDANIAEYTTDEQLKARQIVFRVPATADDDAKAEVKAAADAAMERVQAGEDFAALATELSEDPSSSTGGDLGWVTRGRQVDGWDEAAFALQAGETSAVIETVFGYYIIRVEDRRAARVQPFEEVSAQLEQRLAWDGAESRAAEIAEKARAEVLRGTPLEQVAESNGLTVEQSPLFAQAEGFGEYTSMEFTGRAFAIGQGRVAEPLRVRRGFMVFRVDEIEAAHLPPFAEVTERVRVDEMRERSRSRAQERAAEYVAQLNSGTEMQEIADTASALVDSTELLSRDETVPALGRSPALLEAAFEAGVNVAAGPVEVNSRFIVFRVVEHEQPDWTLFASQAEGLREQEAAQQRNRLFEAYVRALREQYNVTVNQDLIDSISS